MELIILLMLIIGTYLFLRFFTVHSASHVILTEKKSMKLKKAIKFMPVAPVEKLQKRKTCFLEVNICFLLMII